MRALEPHVERAGADGVHGVQDLLRGELCERLPELRVVVVVVVVELLRD